MLNHKALSASVTGPDVDANFKQTVLLLHGDGTNGAQNNTFTDSSTNNFTITRNGNTTQGTFSPFSVAAGEWSVYFDGSDDYLTLPSGDAFKFGTGDFTVECWFYVYTLALGNQYLIDARNSGQTGTWILGTTTTGLRWFNGTSVWDVTTSIPLHSWNHVAYVRSSNTGAFYLNGTRVSTTTDSTDYSTSPTTSYIGSRYSGVEYFNGYISNLRTVKGTAVYSGTTYTVPSSPLTAITNTSLLICQSNRFRDASTNAIAITPYLGVSVQPFSPFAPSAAYSASTNGGSGYFDGSGDYLSMSDNASFQIGSSAFSIELWYYILSSASERRFVSQWASAPNKGVVLTTENLTPRFYYTLDGTTDTSIQSSTTPAINQWNHLVVCRSGSTLSMFLNGSRVTTATQSGTFANVTGDITIGSGVSGNEPMYGYISGLRSVIGSSQYDATQTTITVPTAPPTAVTNTQLLCNFTGAAIFDQTGKNNLETVGNAQIDTGTKKFGTGSLEFDGTGDWLAARLTPDITFGSGDFTVEGWVNPTSLPSRYHAIAGQRTGDTNATIGWTLYLEYGKPTFDFSNGTSSWSNQSSTTLSTGTWYHVAAVRSGNNITVYVNGTGVTATAISGSVVSPGSLVYVGAVSGSVMVPFNGFLDDFRITKGVARYTADFTPPAKAFADQ